MCPVKASADIRESKIAKEPLRNTVALQSSQGCVLRCEFSSVKERESPQLHMPLLTADPIELHVELARENHRSVLISLIGANVIRTQTQCSLLRSRAGCAIGHS